jgi:sialate O-acetylesterase
MTARARPEAVRGGARLDEARKEHGMARRIDAGFTASAALVVIAAFVPPAPADVRLPHVLGSNMVLQRDLAAPVWGWAEPGEEVTVTVAGQECRTRADAGGVWRVRLKPMPPGGPHGMTVSGRNALKLENILVGDVWLCSGQSNMRWELIASSTGKEALSRADLPKIRLFKVPLRSAGQPVQDVAADWSVCSPATAGRFSAVGFFFGRELS